MAAAHLLAAIGATSKTPAMPLGTAVKAHGSGWER